MKIIYSLSRPRQYVYEGPGRELGQSDACIGQTS